MLGFTECTLPDRVRDKLANPFGPGKPARCPVPQCGRPRLRPLVGHAAGRARRLAELGYGAESIALLLGARPEDVRRFLRGGRRRSAPVSPWYPTATDDAWRYGRGARPVIAIEQPEDGEAGAEPINGPDALPDNAGPVAATLEPAPWTGSADINSRRGKLTPADVLEIQQERAKGVSTGKLAKRFNVTRATICYAANGRTFRAW